MHTGRIIPAAGGVVVWWQTNRQFSEEGFPPGLVDLLHGAPELKRTNHSLKDQFAYLYGVIEKGCGSFITCRLRLAMFLHLFVTEDLGEVPDRARADAARPFSWPVPTHASTAGDSSDEG